MPILPPPLIPAYHTLGTKQDSNLCQGQSAYKKALWTDFIKASNYNTVAQ